MFLANKVVPIFVILKKMRKRILITVKIEIHGINYYRKYVKKSCRVEGE